MNVKVKIIIIISVLLITGITLYFLFKKTDHCKNKNKLDYCDNDCSKTLKTDYCDDQCTKLRADYCDDQCTKRKVPQKCCDITKSRADYCDDDCTKLRSEHCDNDCDNKKLKTDYCHDDCQDLRSKYCHRKACLSLKTDHCDNDCDNKKLKTDYCDNDCSKKLKTDYCDNDCSKKLPTDHCDNDCSKKLPTDHCDNDCSKKLKTDHCDNDCSKALRSKYCDPDQCKVSKKYSIKNCFFFIAIAVSGQARSPRQLEDPFLISGRMTWAYDTFLDIDLNGGITLTRDKSSKNKKTWYTKPKVKGTFPFRLILQSDGNLVMYDKEDRVIFDGNTQTNPTKYKKGMFSLKFTDPTDSKYNTYPLYVEGGTDKHYVQNLILKK